MKKCKNCRHVNRDTESFCEECGAPLMNESMHQEENQAQPSMNKGNESTPLRSKRSWIWVFLFVFIILTFPWYDRNHQRKRSFPE